MHLADSGFSFCHWVLAIMDVTKSYINGLLWCGFSGRVEVNLLVVLVVALIALRISLDLLERRKLPPGPFAWPVVGNFPALGGSLPHRTLRILASKYGGLMYLRLGSVPTIVVSTVAVSKELFQTHDVTFLDRPKCMYFDIVTDGYKNMAVANGRYWRELRKLSTSVLFTPKRLATYESARTDEIHAMMRELVADCQEGTRVVDLKSWLLGITSNNMTRMLFNKRYFGASADGTKEKEDFEAMTARTFELSGAFVISDFVPWLGFLTKWQGWQKKMEDLRDCTYDIGGRMLEIEKHRQRAVKDPAAIGVDENENDAKHVPDFLDLLLQTPLENGEPLPDKNLILMVMLDLIMAGTETSATAAEWAVAELMRHPSTMETLQSELTAVVGANSLPRESHLPHLPFLHAVVKEVLRLHPPAALNLPRESTHPFTFRGCQFPRGTRLVVNFFAIHRDARQWEMAEEFKPERWFERDVSAVAGFEGYELTPFSAGRRMCPAAELGYMMVGLLVAHLVHGFEWRLPKGVWEVDMAERFGLTVSMRTPLRLVPTPKHSAFLY